jgi:hypothetical protein
MNISSRLKKEDTGPKLCWRHFNDWRFTNVIGPARKNILFRSIRLTRLLPSAISEAAPAKKNESIIISIKFVWSRSLLYVWQNSRAFALGDNVNFIRGATHHLHRTGPRQGLTVGHVGHYPNRKSRISHMFTVRHFHPPKGGHY